MTRRRRYDTILVTDEGREIAMRLRRDGVDNRAICERLGVSMGTLLEHLKRWRRAGYDINMRMPPPPPSPRERRAPPPPNGRGCRAEDMGIRVAYVEKRRQITNHGSIFEPSEVITRIALPYISIQHKEPVE